MNLSADPIKQVEPILPEDYILLYQSQVLSDSSPTSLLYKVWFELQWHFGRPGGRRTWNVVPANSFVFDADENGEFVFIRPIGNDEGLGFHTSKESMRRMYATGATNCPVRSLQKYLEKRNPLCDMFLQTPRKQFLEKDKVWYLPEGLKDHKLKYMMKHLSKIANLSKMYSNLSVCQHLDSKCGTDLSLQEDESSTSKSNDQSHDL